MTDLVAAMGLIMLAWFYGGLGFRGMRDMSSRHAPPISSVLGVLSISVFLILMAIGIIVRAFGAA